MADTRAGGADPAVGFTCPQCERTIPDPDDACPECSLDLRRVVWPIVRNDLFDVSLLTETLASLRPAVPVVLPPDTTVAAAVEQLCHHRIGCILVGREDEIVGIFSERDAMLRVAERYEEASTAPLAEVMTPMPQMLDIDTPIAFALNLMANGGFRHVPVTKSGALVGVISVRDLLVFLNERYPDLWIAT